VCWWWCCPCCPRNAGTASSAHRTHSPTPTPAPAAPPRSLTPTARSLSFPRLLASFSGLDSIRVGAGYSFIIGHVRAASLLEAAEAHARLLPSNRLKHHASWAQTLRHLRHLRHATRARSITAISRHSPAPSPRHVLMAGDNDVLDALQHAPAPAPALIDNDTTTQTCLYAVIPLPLRPHHLTCGSTPSASRFGPHRNLFR
jgi:hypothetical protein